MTPQPKEQSHSPLPFALDLSDTNGHCGWSVNDANGVRIATVYGYVESPRSPRKTGTLRDHTENRIPIATARLLVEAVNSHARLLAQNEMLRKALEKLLDRAQSLDQSATMRGLANVDALAKARAALEQTGKV